jgi:hypothetical protein
MNFALGGAFNLTVQAQVDAMLVALRTALSGVGSILSISGGWETGAGDTEWYFVTELAVTSITLVNDIGADVDLARQEHYLSNVIDNSTVSTGADYNTSALNWTSPTAQAFAGYPSDSIFSSITGDIYGVMGNFFARTEEQGTFVLNLVDSLGCAASYSAETVPCDGLTFNVQLTAFNDVNDNDVQDGGELGMLDIKLKVWAGITQTTLVDEIITNASGIAAFDLEAGIYNVTVDETYGAAIGRGIITALPKYFEVEVSGTIVYGGSFNEAGLIPIGPAV